MASAGPFKLLDLPSQKEGRFIERKNRFLGTAQLDEEVFYVHIHDPGRLKELLFKGNRVLLRREEGKKRKTSWDLLAAWSNDHWVFVHSGYHRVISERILNSPLSPLGRLDLLKAEQKVGKSRLDFYFEREGERGWIEVKGCTLCKDGIALFPDAPTERGRRHLEEMEKLQGRKVLLVLIFRRDARFFSPNTEMDPRFSEVFFRLLKKGLEVYPVKLGYNGRWLELLGEVPLKLL